MQEINTPHCSSTRVYVSFFRFQKQEERFELKISGNKSQWSSKWVEGQRIQRHQACRSAGDFTSLWGVMAAVLGPTWHWWRSRWRGRSSLTDAPTVAPRRSDWGGCGDKTHTFTHTQKHTGAGKTHSFVQTHEVIPTGWTTWRKSCTSGWWRCSRTPRSWQLVRSSSGCPGSLLHSNLLGLLLGRGPWRWRVEPLRGASHTPLNHLWSDGLRLIKNLFKCV